MSFLVLKSYSFNETLALLATKTKMLSIFTKTWLLCLERQPIRAFMMSYSPLGAFLKYYYFLHTRKFSAGWVFSLNACSGTSLLPGQ